MKSNFASFPGLFIFHCPRTLTSHPFFDALRLGFLRKNSLQSAREFSGIASGFPPENPALLVNQDLGGISRNVIGFQ